MTEQYEISVLLFAGMRQTVGAPSLTIELTMPATVGDIRKGMLERYPEMESVLQSCAFAVDEQYATDGTPVDQQSVVACIPPVSGG